MKEEISKLTFWVYDFFGYLLPGFIFLASFTKANIYVYSSLIVHWGSDNILNYVLLFGLSYVAGHIIAALSSFLLERLILRHILRYPTYQMFKTEYSTSNIIKFFFPGYFRPYSTDFQNAVHKNFRSVFGLEKKDDHDLFWLIYSYNSIHHPIAFKRMMHFLELYGFSRNMSMCFLLISTFTFICGWTDVINGYLWTTIAFIISFILFGNYTKLLRRLNDENYRAFITISTTSTTKEKFINRNEIFHQENQK